MSITVQCSGCKQQYTVPDAIAGKSVKCKKCGVQFPVPSKPAADRPVLMAEPLKKTPPDASAATPAKGQRPEVPFAVWVGIFGGALGFAALVGVVVVGLRVWTRPAQQTVPAPVPVAVQVSTPAPPVAVSRPAVVQPAPSPPGEPRLDAAMGDVAAAVQEMEQALASVKDDASLRAAQQKMKAIQPRLAQAVQTVVDLQGKGAVPANAGRFQADTARVTITVQKFLAEMPRLMAMPGGMDLALDDLAKACSELQKLPGTSLQALGLGLQGLTPPATPPAAPPAGQPAPAAPPGQP
jgi:hypothetical protein